MDKRLIFPLTMFVLAGFSFGYGTWQYFYAQRVQAAADARVASIIEHVDALALSPRVKQDLYASIFRSYPSAPTLLGIDVSGSFASQQVDDHCGSAGQRAVCSALGRSGTSLEVILSVCGTCRPSL